MIEVLKQALEALEESQTDNDTMEFWDRKNKAITAIKEAIREHAMYEVQRLGQEIEQEPVKIVQYNCTCGRTMKFESEHGVIAPQRTWVGLTNEEIESYWDWEDFQTGAGRLTIFEMVRDIEAKLKELNT